ncbi:T. brucei spp.-specific protein [Trypanosoma brucei gambiense DAL972]|uniref:T. brucei spp.-specific protein n=1 Tax=Trypanosoma brucei gambiense (strain MHOM/CI/86/DAL972) TaxID=679716 RepID=D0A0U6_TRYB9|nr:T. brucei spp.-specific protein [Trypanosoma brucei gambiense DAL972]CBH16854.1 T. brucei spp.-specific protein [Trypanosoma brucei gambiense DAL972]|eukprot:XP_011779118.1 T. brucei spp.-specific protein [Trypanosoma brucei gambiense DAL972]
MAASRKKRAEPTHIPAACFPAALPSPHSRRAFQGGDVPFLYHHRPRVVRRARVGKGPFPGSHGADLALVVTAWRGILWVVVAPFGCPCHLENITEHGDRRSGRRQPDGIAVLFSVAAVVELVTQAWACLCLVACAESLRWAVDDCSLFSHYRGRSKW